MKEELNHSSIICMETPIYCLEYIFVHVQMLLNSVIMR